jgi:hypothetical protein
LDWWAFDKVFNHGKRHVAESVYASHPWPMDLTFLSALVELVKQVDKLLPLQTEVELLRGEVEALKREVNHAEQVDIEQQC